MQTSWECKVSPQGHQWVFIVPLIGPYLLGGGGGSFGGGTLGSHENKNLPEQTTKIPKLEFFGHLGDTSLTQPPFGVGLGGLVAIICPDIHEYSRKK